MNQVSASKAEALFVSYISLTIHARHTMQLKTLTVLDRDAQQLVIYCKLEELQTLYMLKH